MRILLDECVAARLARDLSDHDVTTVPRLRWGSLKDGELIRRAARDFDVFLTVDRSIRHQQQLPNDLILITLLSRSIEYKTLRILVPQIEAALIQASPGESIVVGAAPLR